MTREEILAMEPGRILDALVAEYVVGLKEHRKAYPKSFDERVIWFGDPPNVTAYYVPFYSTDISAAWEVVEKMNHLHFDIYRDAGKIGLWGARFEVPKDDAPYELFEHESINVCEAICKAALLTVIPS